MTEPLFPLASRVTMHDSPSEPMRYHPLSDLFPLLEGDAYRALAEDVRDKGILDPIVTLNGMILDGRHRFLAARDCGRPYPMVEFDGDDPVAFVFSRNLVRRH